MKTPTYKKALSAAAAASLLTFVAACGSESEPAAGGAEPSQSSAAEAEGADYAAGDYQAEGNYQSPAGASEVAVDVTLEDGGTIGAVEVKPLASNGTSLANQTKFAGGIADVVVGKNINEIEVDKVAGSSLTGNGFNEAIEQIKADASA